MFWFLNGRNKVIDFLAEMSWVMESLTPTELNELIDGFERDYGKEAGETAKQFVAPRHGITPLRRRWNLFFTRKHEEDLVRFLAEYDHFHKRFTPAEVGMLYLTLTNREMEIVGRFLKQQRRIWRRHILPLDKKESGPGSRRAEDGRNG